MPNWTTTSYAIEGSQKSLENILASICLAMVKGDKYEEYETCIDLGFTEKELKDKRLRGEILEEPKIKEGVLRFQAEEAWDLQDFEALLRQKFPDIKVYWFVQENMLELFVTNDQEGKYFPYRVIVDACIDSIYYIEYFKTEVEAFAMLSKLTGRNMTTQAVEKFNLEYEDSTDDNPNYISIHKIKVRRKGIAPPFLF